MKKDRQVSETPATRFLRERAIAFTEHPYEYEEHGGTRVYLVGIDPSLLPALLDAIPVEVALQE